MNEDLQEEMMTKLTDKVKEANTLLENCTMLSAKNGYQKLQKKIEAELKFLQKLGKYPDRLKEEHLRSSNLFHLASIVNCSMKMDGVVEVLKPYTYFTTTSPGDSEQNQQCRIVVDVVADHGKSWVKVVARNPQALLQSSLGVGSFGRRTLCEQVEEFLICAAQNLYMYQPPKVKIWFAAGITNHLKKILENMGVEVLTQSIHDDLFMSFDDEDDETEQYSERTSMEVFRAAGDISLCESAIVGDCGRCSPDIDNSVDNVPATSVVDKIENDTSRSVNSSNSNSALEVEECTPIPFSPKKDEFENINSSSDSLLVPSNTLINLDVSTMIAYVSSLTNGGCNFKFEEAVLMSQAERERLHPVKSILDNIFEGHQLVCCETACKDFQTILHTVGGAEEKLRAAQLLSKVRVVPDQPSKYALLLHTSSKVRKRSQIIFGTGDTLKALTVTANGHFLRAAESQGIKFVAFVHESRALTESKQMV